MHATARFALQDRFDPLEAGQATVRTLPVGGERVARYIDAGREGWQSIVFFGGLGTSVGAFALTEFPPARPRRTARAWRRPRVRVELKQQLLTAASRAAGPEIVFGSSTSGLRPTLLQERMEHPERFVVGHPFNPVYLLPLVELCAGAATLARAQNVYRSVGMHPLGDPRRVHRGLC